MQQNTLKQACTFSGIGLHSGETVKCTVRPAPADTGIAFVLHNGEKKYHLCPSPYAVSATNLATTLSANEGGENFHVSTVEHLLAAIRGLGIDNVYIDVFGHEIPVMDGSANEFVKIFKKIGLEQQNTPRRVLRVSREVTIEEGNKLICAKPYDGLHISYTIDFAHPLIGKQHLSLDINPKSFEKLMFARTFGFLKDVEMMKKMNLAKGGSLDNAVVLDEQNVLNEGGLRRPDEFVRHKILDFVGDIAVLQLPLQGSFEVHCSGHAFNNQLLRHLIEKEALDLITLGKNEKNTSNSLLSPAMGLENLVLA